MGMHTLNLPSHIIHPIDSIHTHVLHILQRGGSPRTHRSVRDTSGFLSNRHLDRWQQRVTHPVDARGPRGGRVARSALYCSLHVQAQRLTRCR